MCTPSPCLICPMTLRSEWLPASLSASGFDTISTMPMPMLKVLNISLSATFPSCRQDDVRQTLSYRGVWSAPRTCQCHTNLLYDVNKHQQSSLA